MWYEDSPVSTCTVLYSNFRQPHTYFQENDDDYEKDNGSNGSNLRPDFIKYLRKNSQQIS
jgi:hypothetical protein